MQIPLICGGIPCHHVQPWAPRRAQHLCQALLIGHVSCPTQRGMEPGRELMVVSWLWGSPAPWQDTQNPTVLLEATGSGQQDAPLQQQVKVR